MTHIALSLALAAALAGCTGTHEAQTDGTWPEAHPPMPQDFSIRRLSPEAEAGFRHHSGMESATREVVRDAEGWGRMWGRLSGSMGGRSPAPPVDFAREMALVATMGQRNTGGYEIRIESVERGGSGLVAHVVETSPGPRCGTGAALSRPADVVLVPRTDQPVEWTVRRAVTHCP